MVERRHCLSVLLTLALMIAGPTRVAATETVTARMTAIPLGVSLPEALAVDAGGVIWFGSDDGTLYRLDEGRVNTVSTLDGLSIGLAYDAARHALWSATFGVGLQRISLGSQPPAVSLALPHPFPEDVLVLPDGRLVLTIASDTLTPQSLAPDAPLTEWNLIDPDPTGRVVLFDPSSGAQQTLAGSLAFPSGLVVMSGEEAVLVVELASRRLLKVALDGTGFEVFAADLPGIPDDIAGNGPFWISLPAPPPRLLPLLRASPALAWAYRWLPTTWQQRLLAPPVDRGQLLLMDAAGTIRCRLQFPDMPLSLFANLVSDGDRLLVGMLAGSEIYSLDPETIAGCPAAKHAGRRASHIKDQPTRAGFSETDLPVAPSLRPGTNRCSGQPAPR